MLNVPRIVTDSSSVGGGAVLTVESEPATDAVFSGDFKTACSVGLTIRNRSSVPARFRVKTNRPSRLSSRPCAGELPPHSSAAVAITVSPFDYRKEEGRSDEVEANSRKRKSSTAGAAFLLMVYASEKGENVERAEKDQWSDFSPSELHVRKIRAFFDFTPFYNNSIISSSSSSSVPSAPSSPALKRSSSHGFHFDSSSSGRQLVASLGNSVRFLSPLSAASNSGSSSNKESKRKSRSEPSSSFRRGSHVKPEEEEEEEEEAEDANYSGFEMVRTPSVASLTSLEQKRKTREKELEGEKEKEEKEDKKREEEQKEEKKKEEESRAADRQVMMANAREKVKEVAKQALEIGTKLAQTAWSASSASARLSSSALLPVLRRANEAASQMTGEAKVASGVGAIAVLLVAFEAACYVYS